MLFLDAMTPLGLVLISIPAILIFVGAAILVVAGVRLIVTTVRRRRAADNAAEKENETHDNGLS